MSSPQPAITKMPSAVAVLAMVAIGIIIFPLVALWHRINVTHIPDVVRQPTTHDLLRVTLGSAAWATILCILLGVPLALFTSSLKRGGAVTRLLVFLPLALPPVVAGLALSAAIGRRGVLAPLLDTVGIHFAFAYPGVVAAHVFIALPFVVVIVDSAFRQLNKEVVQSAAGIGMTPMRIVVHIILPALAPSIVSGAGLAFARSLGEFGTTLTFAGSLPGVTRTMPIGIYLEREIDPEAADALAALLMLIALLALLVSHSGSLLARVRAPRQRPVAIGAIDSAALRRLTRPASPVSEVMTVVTERGTVSIRPQVATAIIGPNGAGKTTLLGLISGRLLGAHVTIGSRVVSQLPPQKRSTVVLTQSPGLPPHATVRQAVTMATRARAVADELLAVAGLATLADVRCRHLSGGQAAQVALLRALAARPSIMLLDEPLAAVDMSQARQWRAFLQDSKNDRTCVFVSHDPFDVSALAHDVVVMEQGQPVACGAVTDMMAEPVNSFVAEFAGLNVIPGVIDSSSEGISVLVVGEQRIMGVSTTALEPGSSAHAIFTPDSVTLATYEQDISETSARNQFTACVIKLTPHGAVTTVTLDIGSGVVMSVPITTISARTLGIKLHNIVRCSIKTMAITIVKN
ncbi:molybdenum ABC transporter ATP-binding protein [Corynebacterium diphtheriae]|nr:molybdenum ABC transporter ATP-binding protein [Corynebacterium diphtheriae]CAB0984494.1 molybdenum ABC transporter ATP-binding protein [Corynebacterium diphtheriae]